MFLTRMVSGFICSKNSNKNANSPNQSQQQQQQQPHQQQQQATQQSQQSKSPKPNKKTEKCKRSLLKTDSKKSISELLKTPSTAKDPTAATQFSNVSGSTCTSTSAGPSNSNTNSNNSHCKEVPSTSKAALKPPTKVKSGSWKRSEKQISGYNSISVSGKKSKSLRKRSPTWLKFPNTPVKIAEKVTYVSPADSASVCRPGTLYSDVLFGAGSSCLVKIKTLTPRRNTNTAQKKLTKALLKCTGSENDAPSDSEPEVERELFPSLNGAAPTDGGSKAPTPPAEANKPNVAATPVKSDGDGDGDGNGADVVDVEAPNEGNGVRVTENGFKQMNGATTTLATKSNSVVVTNGDSNNIGSGSGSNSCCSSTRNKPFTIDIPQWNFLDADVSSDAYPKFLCQFEDEHYLKAEKMALLGLKLALGNGNSNPQQGKFKF